MDKYLGEKFGAGMPFLYLLLRLTKSSNVCPCILLALWRAYIALWLCLLVLQIVPAGGDDYVPAILVPKCHGKYGKW